MVPMNDWERRRLDAIEERLTTLIAEVEGTMAVIRQTVDSLIRELGEIRKAQKPGWLRRFLGTPAVVLYLSAFAGGALLFGFTSHQRLADVEARSEETQQFLLRATLIANENTDTVQAVVNRLCELLRHSCGIVRLKQLPIPFWKEH